MNNFNDIKALIGETVTEEDLKHVDCYVYRKLGIFIPSTGKCGYAARDMHSHPAYMAAIFFHPESGEKKQYTATLVSPDIPHNDIEEEYPSYYCIMIDREYFEAQYRLYHDRIPSFSWPEFSVSSDVLKAINTFAFECAREQLNAEVTLEAQTTLITHWLIRSVLGENLDVRSISSDSLVARVQHYIEQHFGESLAVEDLAGLVHMSASTLTRSFKRETGLSPIKYLIEIRIEKAKDLLKKSNIPITTIADRCGFSSSSHFATEFKKLTDVTPSEFREVYHR